MAHLPAVLFAAIDTGTWSVEQARAWADRFVQIADAPAAWLMDLSVASTRNKAADSVRHGFEERGMVLPDDFGELLTGMLFLRFQRGDLTWQQFEAEVADVLDAYGVSAFADVETWTEEMGSGLDEIPQSFKLPLERMAGRSAEALDELENIDLHGSEGFFLDQ